MKLHVSNAEANLSGPLGLSFSGQGLAAFPHPESSDESSVQSRKEMTSQGTN